MVQSLDSESDLGLEKGTDTDSGAYVIGCAQRLAAIREPRIGPLSLADRPSALLRGMGPRKGGRNEPELAPDPLGPSPNWLLTPLGPPP